MIQTLRRFTAIVASGLVLACSSDSGTPTPTEPPQPEVRITRCQPALTESEITLEAAVSPSSNSITAEILGATQTQTGSVRVQAPTPQYTRQNQSHPYSCTSGALRQTGNLAQPADPAPQITTTGTMVANENSFLEISVEDSGPNAGVDSVRVQINNFSVSDTTITSASPFRIEGQPTSTEVVSGTVTAWDRLGSTQTDFTIPLAGLVEVEYRARDMASSFDPEQWEAINPTYRLFLATGDTIVGQSSEGRWSVSLPEGVAYEIEVSGDIVEGLAIIPREGGNIENRVAADGTHRRGTLQASRSEQLEVLVIGDLDVYLENPLDSSVPFYQTAAGAIDFYFEEFETPEGKIRAAWTKNPNIYVDTSDMTEKDVQDTNKGIELMREAMKAVIFGDMTDLGDVSQTSGAVSTSQLQGSVYVNKRPDNQQPNRTLLVGQLSETAFSELSAEHPTIVAGISFFNNSIDTDEGLSTLLGALGLMGGRNSTYGLTTDGELNNAARVAFAYMNFSRER